MIVFSSVIRCLGFFVGSDGFKLRQRGAAVNLWSINRVSLEDRFWKYLGFQLRSRTNGCRRLRSQRECGVNSGLEIPKVGKGRSW